ncbi:cytochrome b561-like [Cimex lectularius]|uniref:Cytochrome b561 domain-containing protein n=1 Tax=Cimex lectularius TaxID=79782 RepID=A0A8I6STC0_CIMLE|nr:cytochrome b561-like [Cimex lectularius]
MYPSWRLSIFIGSQVFGALSVFFVLSTVVTGQKKSRDMQWHSVLMTLSTVYLIGSSVTIYRGLPWLKMFKLKLFHGLIHLAALLLAIAGVVLAFDFHDNIPLSHLISLHSIFGLIAVILLGLQWITGLLFFLHPKIPVRVDKHAVPSHATAGLIIFLLGCANALIGLNEYTKGAERTDKVMLATASGFFIFIFMLLVLHLIMKDTFKREPLSDDK